ncbi:MAG TPA: WecB/TagA/CpsF family glycosyltransferase [Actinomycetota bacterium]|nr:WecB/TagA/CpsF family glycosyltransferase [Actinomycetota bacterium]
MSRAFPTIDILGVPFARLEPGAALDEAERLYEREAPAMIAHANVHTLNLASQDPSYRQILQGADMVLNDGKGVMLGARLLGHRFPADLNGNFFSPLVVARAAARGWPVFLLGAKPGVPERLADVLRAKHPDIRIIGCHHGHFTADEEPEVVLSIREQGTGLLLVGMGNPHQERFLSRRLTETGARLGIGVGAFFDFQTGTVPRAPQWMNRYGLEWVFRLAQEPKRMWHRYLVGNPAFVKRVLEQKRSRT